MIYRNSEPQNIIRSFSISVDHLRVGYDNFIKIQFSLFL